jgi:glycosyltransferase involved in cell wall biosynthesis
MGRRLTRWRLRRGKPRTLWGVTPILTLPLLARADRLLGAEGKSFVYQTYYISRTFDINLSWIYKNVLSKNTLVYIGATYWILAWLMLRYDVFHYFYDRGILLPPNMRLWIDPHELETLKAADKRIYTYAYGADVRTREATLALGKFNFCADCDAPGRYCICSEDEAQRNINGVHKYANAMVSMIDMIHYVPGCRNLHYWPIDVDKIAYVGTQWDKSRPIRLLHAPNHMHFKGSRYLFAAIEQLQSEGVPIELKTISGVSNAEVLQSMAEADVVAEQFIGGAYGYTAIEAWAMGKPVLTYVRDETVPANAQDFPGINTNPDTLYEILKSLAAGAFDLGQIGRQSRRYVERYYSIEAVALGLGKMYAETAEAPPAWRSRLAERIAGIESAMNARLNRPLRDENDVAGRLPSQNGSSMDLAAVDPAPVAATTVRQRENWMNLPIIRRKIRSAFIHLRLAREQAQKMIGVEADYAIKHIKALQTRDAPLPHPRPSSERMPVPPDPDFPPEVQHNIDGYNDVIKKIGAAVPWPAPQYPLEKRVVMLATSNLRIDPRIERESRALAGRGYEVVVVAPDISKPPMMEDPPIDWGPGVSFHALPINDINFIGWPPYFYSDAMIEAAISHKPFAIHANDLWTALIALEAGRRTGALPVADFHEWTSENVSWNVKTSGWQAHDEAMASAFRELEIMTMRRSAATITVNATIARALEELAGLDEGRVDVIRNIPKLDAIPTREYRSIKAELGLPESAFVILYQGGTGPSRLLEPIIESLVYTPDVNLVIRGPSLDMFGDGYRRAARRVDVSDRVFLLDAVPSRDVVAAAKGADVGVWSLPDISKNFRFALPNKVFEYLAAGVPLAVADYPEPAAIVESGKCGVVFDPYNPKSIGDAIGRLQSDPDFRRSCTANTAIALARLDADAEWDRYADIYDRLWARANSPPPKPVARPLRVLHAPCNVGNQPWSLSRAERNLGLKSELVINYATRFNYPADRVLGAVGGRAANYLTARRTAAAGAPYDYDALHYYFGRSLAFWDDLPDLNVEPFADLKAAHAAGKTVIMTLQGCDVRLAAQSNARNAHTPCAAGRCPAFETCVSTLDAHRQQMIDDILPLCDRIFYLNPELGHFVPNGLFLPYANVDIQAVTPQKRPDSTEFRRPRIVHAPSHAAIKGTDEVLAALDRLAKRHDFELVLVHDKTHEEAMKIYRTADIAIDQILAGWYGGVSVELMAMGVPVMCYLREADFSFLPPAMVKDLPILNIRPDNLERDIEAALLRSAEWAEIGLKSRAFVETWHDPMKIAAWMAKVYASPKETRPFDPYVATEAS